MKKYVLLLLCAVVSTFAAGCKNKNYDDRKVNIFRQADTIDKQISLRFYKETPNIPYIDVADYYREFFSASPSVTREGDGVKYTFYYNNYLYFNTSNNSVSCTNLNILSAHPDFKSSVGKHPVALEKSTDTGSKVKTIDLNKYGIKIYSTGFGIYAPVSFLSKFFGGIALYNVAYNGSDLYVLDIGASISDYARNTTYYGVRYNANLDNLNTSRGSDLALYTYHELCMVFDNFRGETEQMIFGDEKFRSLGLDELLTIYHPDIKTYLLSTDKLQYYAGLYALFAGLNDGGHTGLLTNFNALQTAISKYSANDDFYSLSSQSRQRSANQTKILNSFRDSKLNSFGTSEGNYFVYDQATKVACIGFDKFAVDYVGWNNYYTGSGAVPTTTDTYAYVRKCFYKAQYLGAEKVVLDITTNGGGDTNAFNCLVGLINHSKSDYYMKDIFNDFTTSEKLVTDINLDGKWNKQDQECADSFTFEIGVLTSPYSFSCANLFPSALKELGYKVIGQQSGGGSCAIAIGCTADGVSYVRSSHLTLCDSKGHNIDAGVPVDYYIDSPIIEETGQYDASNFYNFTVLADAFN